MFEKGRTKKLALLGAITIALGLSAVAPAFAWSSTLNTTILCSTSSTGTFSKCSSTSPVPSGMYVKDDGSLYLTYDTPICNNAANCGTISFYLVSGSAPGTCPDAVPAGATAEGSTTVTSSNVGYTLNYYSNVLTGLSSGTYYFYVFYQGGASTYPNAYKCEQFTGTTGGSFPPPPTVPQFPLGMALLLALAIPGLLLVRSKYASKTPSSPLRI